MRVPSFLWSETWSMTENRVMWWCGCKTSQPHWRGFAWLWGDDPVNCKLENKLWWIWCWGVPNHLKFWDFREAGGLKFVAIFTMSISSLTWYIFFCSLRPPAAALNNKCQHFWQQEACGKALQTQQIWAPLGWKR